MDVPSFAPDRKKCINAIFAPDHFRGRTRRADPGPMEPEPRTTNAGTAAAARSYARSVVRALGRGLRPRPTIYARARSPTPFSTSHLTIISLSWGNYRCVSNRDNSAQSGESEPRPITGRSPAGLDRTP